MPIGVDGTAEAQFSMYGPLPESEDPFGDFSYQLETGLVLSGDRVAVLSQLTIGQDYNWPRALPSSRCFPTPPGAWLSATRTPASVNRPTRRPRGRQRSRPGSR